MSSESLSATYHPKKSNILLFDRSALLLVILVNLFVAINIFVLGETSVMTTLVYFLIFTIFFFNNDKLLFYLLFISLVTSNFFTGSIGSYEFENYFTASITADLSEAIAYSLVLIIVLKNKVRELLHFNELSIALLIFVAYCFFTAIFAEYPDFTIQNALRLVSFFILYLLTVYYIRTEIIYVEFINVVVASSLFISLIIPFKLALNIDVMYNGGAYFLFMLPILLNILSYVVLQKKMNVTNFVFYATLVTFGIISMIITYSRRYFIAFTIYIIMFLIIIRSKLVSITSVIIITIGLIVFISLPGQLFFRIDETFETIESSFEMGSSDKLTESSSFYNKRDILFNYGVQIFAEYPITGCGFLNSNKIIGRMTGTEMRIHNLYLQILADLGLIGFLIYFIILIILFMKLYNAQKYFASTGNLFMRFQSYGFILYIIVVGIVASFGAHVIYSKFDWIIYGIVTAISDNLVKNKFKTQNAER